MYVCSGRSWYAGTEQKSSGSFLLLALPTRPAEPAAIQCTWSDLSDPALKRKCSGSGTCWPDEYFTCPECGRKTGGKSFRTKFTEARGFVRHVKLSQCGHWMMGSMKLYVGDVGLEVTLSGSYGSDGLPTDLPREFWEQGVPLPEDLANAWAKGDGWNSSGSEGPRIRAWANENLKALRQAGKKRKAVKETA